TSIELLSRRPLPSGPRQFVFACELRLSVRLGQDDRVTLRLLLERVDQDRRMRDDDDLRAIRGCSNQPPECWKQVGMQAGLWFVQYQQFRRPWRQERRHPQEISQRPVR